MSNKKIEKSAFIDTIPNWLNNPEVGKEHRERLFKVLQESLNENKDNILNRYASLPILLVEEGEYTKLLDESRWLFNLGFFYSCVAMCGIAAERILKDIYVKTLLINQNGKIEPINKSALKSLEFLGAKHICIFLSEAGVINKKLKVDIEKLAELRNKYTHARGGDSEKDARKAITYLHNIVEKTVSLFKQAYNVLNT